VKKIKRTDIVKIYNRLNEQGVETSTIQDLILVKKERVCLGCGCSDMHACENGCFWLEIDRDSGFGICSECEEFIDDYKE
jgi:hypothetical protein